MTSTSTSTTSTSTPTITTSNLGFNQAESETFHTTTEIDDIDEEYEITTHFPATDAFLNNIVVEEVTEDHNTATEISFSDLISVETVMSTAVDGEELLQFDVSREDIEITSITERTNKNHEEIGTEKIQIEEITEMPALMHTLEIGTTEKLQKEHEILIDEDLETHLFLIENYYEEMEENSELTTISKDREGLNSTLPVAQIIENNFQEMTDLDILNFEGSGAEIVTEIY